MKRTVTVLLLIILVAGCTPHEPIGTETNSPDMIPSETVSTETGAPDATPGEPENIDPGNDEKNVFYDLKTEFENEIKQAALGISYDWAWGIGRTFEEMLQYRQSLEDINEEFGAIYNERYDDFWMSIDVREVFTDGKTNYRIVLFSTMYLPYERMYIQIYDEEHFESKCIGEYAQEGGSYEEVLYCSFINESNKNYLIIIEKEYYAVYEYAIIRYYLVNYEIDGLIIKNYTALKEDGPIGIWYFDELFSDYYGKASIRISYYDMTQGSNEAEYYGSLDHYCRESFKNNKFTIMRTVNDQDNKSKDEISLLFKDGFWEIIGTYPPSAPIPDGQATGPGSNNEHDYRKKYESIIAGWKSTYEKAIRGETSYSEEYSFDFYSGGYHDSIKAYYALYDIDGNGIPELILKKGCEDEDIIAYIFSLEDDIPVSVFGYDAEGHPCEVPWSRIGSSAILENGLIDSIFCNYALYKISDDGCHVIKIASCEPYDYPDEASLAEAKWRYYVYDTQVDYDVYVQYLNTLGYITDGNNSLAIIDWYIID